MGGGGAGKAYLMYTCENVDNYEQPLILPNRLDPFNDKIRRGGGGHEGNSLALCRE